MNTWENNTASCGYRIIPLKIGCSEISQIFSPKTYRNFELKKGIHPIVTYFTDSIWWKYVFFALLCVTLYLIFSLIKNQLIRMLYLSILYNYINIQGTTVENYGERGWSFRHGLNASPTFVGSWKFWLCWKCLNYSITFLSFGHVGFF